MSDVGLISKLSNRIKSGISTLRKNPIPFLFVALAYSAVEMAFMKQLAPYLATHSLKMALSATFIFAVIELVAFEAVRIIFVTGFISMMLNLVYDQPVQLSDFSKFISKKRLKRVLLVEAIVLPIMIAGFTLLILPGLIWFVLTIFSYVIVLKNEDDGIFDSISKSISMTTGIRTELFTICIAYGILSFVSSLLPLLSLIVDTLITPILYVVITMMYKEKTSA